MHAVIYNYSTLPSALYSFLLEIVIIHLLLIVVFVRTWLICVTKLPSFTANVST